MTDNTFSDALAAGRDASRTDAMYAPEPFTEATVDPFSQPVDQIFTEQSETAPQLFDTPTQFQTETGEIDVDALLASHAELEAALTPSDGLSDFMHRDEGTEIAVSDEEWSGMRFAFNDLPEQFQTSSTVQQAFTEFASTGMVTEEMLGALTTETGLQRGELVEQMDAIAFTYSGQRDQVLNELVGGAEAYERMIEWALGNLREDQLKHFNRMIDCSPATAIDAIQTLWQTYTENTNEVLRSPAAVNRHAQQSRESLAVGASPQSPHTAPFASDAEMVQAISDPRYKSDPSYRAWVESRM